MEKNKPNAQRFYETLALIIAKREDVEIKVKVIPKPEVEKQRATV